MANNHSTLIGLFTDIADAIRAKGGGGGDTLTWDGNTEGLEASGDAYKVSDATPSINDFANGCSVVFLGGTTKEFTSDDLEVMDTGMGVTVIVSSLGEFMIMSGDLQLGDGTITKKGTYFLHAGDATTVSLTIPGYTGFASKIVADNFPTAIAAIDTQEDLDPELSTQDDLIAQIATALEGKTGASGSAVDIPTCTVFISDNGDNTAYINGVYATIYDKNSNVISSYKYSGYTVLTHVVENVIKGTPILVYGIYDNSDSIGATRIFSAMVNDYTAPSMISLFEVNDTSAYINLSNSYSEPPEEQN